MNTHVIIVLVVIVLATVLTSVGYANKTSILSIADFSWHEVVDKNGNIAISHVTVNVTNTSTDVYGSFKQCSDIILVNTSKSKQACFITKTLSPQGQANSTQSSLALNFTDTPSISDLSQITFHVQKSGKETIRLQEKSDLEIKTEDVVFKFENVKSSGDINIETIAASKVPNTLSVNTATEQVVVNLMGINYTSISDVHQITHTSQFEGDITLTLSYDPSLIPSGHSEKNLKLLRFSNGAWTEVGFTVNVDNNTITGIIPGFSQFMVSSPPDGIPGGNSSFRKVSAPQPIMLDMHLYGISWDFCDNNIVKVTVGSFVDKIGVNIRVPDKGLVTAKLSDEQPFPNKSVFEAKIDPSTRYFVVQVEGISSGNAMIIQHSVNLDKCSGGVTVESDKPYDDMPSEDTVKPSAMPSPAKSPIPDIQDGKRFGLHYKGDDFNIGYKIDSGLITGMTIDEKRSTLLVSLDITSPDHLIISLPRNLIDAVDDKFIIFETGSESNISYSILKSEQDYVIILAYIPQDTSEISILGTSIIPEFPLGAIITMAMIFLVAIMFSARKPLFV